MLDATLDYRVFSAIFCLLAIIYLLVARKNFTAAAHSWALFAFDLGGQQLGGVSFAILYTLLGYFIIFELVVRNAKQGERARNKHKILPLTIILGVILLKIGIDSFIYGFNEYRYTAIYASQLSLFIPLIILALNIKLYGITKTLKDLVISGTVLFTVVLIPLLPSILMSQLIPAITESYRITIFQIDTINSCRLFAYCAVFAYAAYFLTRHRLTRLFLVAIMVLSVLLVILNGTRQYLLAIIAVAFFCNIRTITVKQIAVIVILVIGLSYLYSNSATIQNIELVNRISSRSIQEEETQNRGLIWATQFKKMFEQNPIAGLGFRNSGEETIMVNNATNQEEKTKDNAHGFFQEVFVEHGVILGLLLTIAFIHAFLLLRKKLHKYDTVTKRIVIATCIVFILPLFLSGAVLNGFGVFYFALLASRLN